MKYKSAFNTTWLQALLLVIIAILLSFTFVDSNWSVLTTIEAQEVPKDKVSVMYAASLIKTFEDTLGPAFQNETGYIYDGEPRGSVQVANTPPMV